MPPLTRSGPRPRASGRRASLPAAAALLASACGTATDPDAPSAGRAATVQLQATVRLADQQTTDLSVQLRSRYQRASELSVGLNEVVVPLGAPQTQQVRYPIDLAPCLADRERVPAGPACRVTIRLTLRRGAQVLDDRELPPLDLAPGASVQAPPVVLAEVASVTIAPDTAAAFVGGTRQLQAVARDAQGAVVPRDLVWRSTAAAVATVSPTGLVAGVAAGQAGIIAAASDLPGAAADTVLVTVLPRPAIILQPATVAIAAAAGGPGPDAATVAVTNGGGGTLSGLALGAVAYSAGASGWLTVSLDQPEAPATVRLVATTQSLAAGTYSATVPVTSPGAGNSPQTIAVQLVVSPSQPGTVETTTAALGVHSCSTFGGVQLWCWGRNTLGQLGDGSFASPRTRPVAVQAPQGVTFAGVSGGFEFTCARSTDGRAWCWGNGAQGQLGTGSATSSSVPAQVQLPPGVTVVQVVSGFRHACGLTAAGQTYCWGQNAQGQLGIGTVSASVLLPQAVAQPQGVTFVRLTLGDSHSCGLTAGGALWCWGINQGRMGNGTTTQRDSLPVATTLPLGQVFAAASAGSGHTCAVTPSGVLYCWGIDTFGELGLGVPGVTRSTPQPVTTSEPIAAIVTGEGHTCALGRSGAVYCMGDGSAGQMGDGVLESANLPAAVTLPGGLGFTRIDARRRHTCGSTTNGAVYCWGEGGNSQIGDGASVDRAVPTLVPPP